MDTDILYPEFGHGITTANFAPYQKAIPDKYGR